MQVLAIVATVMAVGLASTVFAADNMQAFPPPDAGQTRHVLHLDKQADESLFKVEVVVGKTVEVDEANRYFFGGRIDAESIVGWGFTRYVVKDLGPMAGTRMAVSPDMPKVQRFITLGGEPFLVRYNSKLPIVVYVPQGAEVRYRIWKTDPDATAIEKG